MARPGIATTHVGGSLWLVQLEGEHDVSTVSDLRREVDRIFETGTCLVIDLSAATFVDSSILGELIRSELHTESSPGEQMAVVAPPGSPAAHLFNLVGAKNTLFPVFDSVDAAMESCREPALRPA
jgi:anti-anti-sigma factor